MEQTLTRSRKVLEFVVRDVYHRRCNEPPGTRPLENLLQTMVRAGYFPSRLEAYATSIRMLGNVGTHKFGEKITSADVYLSITQFLPILEWYFETERPIQNDAPAQQERQKGQHKNPDSILLLAHSLMAEHRWLEAGSKLEEYAQYRPDDWESCYS